MPPDSFTLIAHRGASATAPENTLSAFRRAAALGSRWIECDVRLTKDRVPVILHDATVKRTTNGRGSVARLTYRQLRKLDAGEDERIPSLREIFKFSKKHRVNFVLEIKDPRALIPTLNLIQTNVRANGRSSLPFIISSFSSSLILHAKQLLPRLTTALIIQNQDHTHNLWRRY